LINLGLFHFFCPYRALLWLRTGPPQVGGGIGPLGLVGPWIGYQVFQKIKNKNLGLSLYCTSHNYLHDVFLLQ